MQNINGHFYENVWVKKTPMVAVVCKIGQE